MTFKRMRISTVIRVVGITALAIVFLLFIQQLLDKRSTLRMFYGFWKLESTSAEQQANRLADDIRRVAALRELQPWALETMDRFRVGQVQTNEGGDLYWTLNEVKLAPKETPDFIRKQWVVTNEFGEVWPEIHIVLTNGAPEYTVISWSGYGVAVGSTQYQLAFDISGSTEVSPGVYTFFLDQ